QPVAAKNPGIIYANQLNFENYPIVSITCLIQTEKENDTISDYKIIENGIEAEVLSKSFIKTLDNKNIIVKLTYSSIFPLFITRDLVLGFDNSDEKYKGDNIIFMNNGEIFI